MTNAEIIQAVRNEIDKLYCKYKDKFLQCGDHYHLGLFDGLDMAKRVLDTLESEKPMNPEDAMKELDEKIALVKRRGTWDGIDVDKYMDEVRGREPEKPMNQDEALNEEIKKEMAKLPFFIRGKDQIAFARHFAQWGAEHSVSSETPKDLKEAVKNYIYKAADSPGDVWTTDDIRNAYIAGYKLHEANTPLPEDTVLFNKGVEEGKRLMMEEAVEADIMLTLHDKTGDVSLHTGYLPKELGIKCDDKVRIIIVKEEN